MRTSVSVRRHRRACSRCSCWPWCCGRCGGETRGARDRAPSRVLALADARLVSPASARPPRSIRRNVATPATLDDAIAQLEAALQRDPRQAEGWRLLGRPTPTAQQLGEARDAYAHAAQLAPDDPDVLVEAARSARAGRAATPLRRRRPSRCCEHALAGATAAPARALVPRHRAAPGRQARRSGEDLGAAAGAGRCEDRRRRCARRSTPRAAKPGLPPLPAAAPPPRRPALLQVQRAHSIPTSPRACACAATPACS